MEKLLNLGFDFDGVIADTRHLMREICLSLYGKDLPIHHFSSRETLLKVLAFWRARKIYITALGSDDWGVDRLEQMYEAIYYLKMILNNGHKVSIITKRQTQNQASKAEAWLKKHGEIVSGIPVYWLEEGVSKVGKARELNLDLFVDDQVDNLTELSSCVPNLVHFKDERIIAGHLAGIRSVTSWQSLYELISLFQKGVHNERAAQSWL